MYMYYKHTDKIPVISTCHFSGENLSEPIMATQPESGTHPSELVTAEQPTPPHSETPDENNRELRELKVILVYACDILRFMAIVFV